ncbi:hypothetical protein EW145_g4841 [Phellinidium pouzarii]|uniref:Xylanolytic transcriptional activator regulatory domain-containing protein n=1 Tax=Phellinidium pouzarii TaxID=167371 RepID=A0A4S4L298_9AGAM|nr:hypothetical protein EW145_g4841 [Phellinidium pouzarii]
MDGFAAALFEHHFLHIYNNINIDINLELLCCPEHSVQYDLVLLSTVYDVCSSRDAKEKNAQKIARQLCRVHEAETGTPVPSNTSRGVEHLCRWELEPFARPAPTRPPGAEKSSLNVSNDKSSASLTDATPGPSESSPSASPSPGGLAAGSAVAHEGEYLGAGSLVCALHRLDDSASPQIPIDKSSGLPFSMISQYSSAVSSTFTSSLQNLILGIPEKARCDTLIADFFEHENWHYGLPQSLISNVYQGMWDTIQADLTSLIRIDFNWVTLLFALFAISPACTSEEESRKYFLQALTGKRLADDLLCASFVSPRVPVRSTQGTAHGCLAAALIAEYMCERGQMTEAWKLVGAALRNAQNYGLHLNPSWSKWKDMNEEEKTLRSLAWHLLALKDKFLSFVLGRPNMVRARDTDVPLPTVFPASLASDGSTNATIIYQACMSSMFDDYLSVRPDLSDGGVSFDAKMYAWEATLPTYLALRHPDTTFDHAYPYLQTQRSLTCIPSGTTQTSEMPSTKPRNCVWDCNKLTGLAISLLHAQKAFLATLRWQRQVSLSLTFLVFEAAITLTISLLREADNRQAEEWRKERDAAIELLEVVQGRDHGDIVRQATLVLRVLQDSKPGKTESARKAAEVAVPNVPAPHAAEGDSLSWPSLDSMTIATAASTLPGEVFESLDLPLDWMMDGLNGTVTAFDLLHSL